jgi:hypothetical protein
VHSTNSVEADSFLEQYGDAVAWGGCTILYLLGQQLRFELLDFTYHVLAVAEAEALLSSTQASLAEKSKSGHHTLVIQKTPISKISREWCICRTTFPSDYLLNDAPAFDCLF